MLTSKVNRRLLAMKLPPHASLLAGFSGGPDSTCLASILLELAARSRFSLACAYLDHGLRPEAERRAEQEHVVEFCRSRGLPLHAKHLAAGELAECARRSGLSLEEAARRARIEFFRELRQAHGFNILCLGHTLDDQLETTLIRVLQGSGPGGIRGIRARSGWIIRPLLKVTRDEILDYLRERNLPFVTDSTNEEDRFLRNQVRHKLIPVCREIFPGLGRSLIALSEKAAFTDMYLKHMAKGAIHWEKTAQGVKTNAEAFFSAPPVLRLYALYQACGPLPLTGDEPGKTAIPYRFLTPLVHFKPGPTARFPKFRLRGRGLDIRCSRMGLFLETDIVAPDKKGYVINVLPDTPFTLLNRRYVLTHSSETPALGGRLLCAFHAAAVEWPIVLRSRKAGDRISLDFGRKKLKKLFNDWRVSREERESIPLIQDGKGVLAVLGEPAGFRNVVRAGADALNGQTIAAPPVIRLYELADG